jgi:hypothetical protein
MRLLDGFVTTQLLYVAAELGVADVLADGPRSGAQIAAEVGVAEGPLVRVLRGLVVEDALAEEDDGRFSLTPVGACLPALRGSAQARADLYYRAAPGLLDAVRAGGTAFEHVYGEPFFTDLEHDADHQAAFEASMAGRAAQEARDVVDAYDFTPFRRLVDVGGGRGVLLAAVLGAAPRLHGVLVDREPVMPAARPISTPPAWAIGPTACAATSSTRFPTPPTPTSSVGCSTTGATPTRRASSPRAGAP